MQLGNFIYLNLSKKEVRKKDMTRLDEAMTLLERSGKLQKGCLALAYDYNDYSEEIYEIRDIRVWVAKAVKKYPHMFYFLNQLPSNSFEMTLMCISEYRLVAKGESLTVQELIRKYGSDQSNHPQILTQITSPPPLYSRIKESVEKYGKKIKDSEGASDVVKELKRVTNKKEG